MKGFKANQALSLQRYARAQYDFFFCSFVNIFSHFQLPEVKSDHVEPSCDSLKQNLSTTMIIIMDFYHMHNSNIYDQIQANSRSFADMIRNKMENKKQRPF